MDTRKVPLTGEEILRGELPPLKWVVDGLIAEGDRVMMYGEFSSGKSWIAQHLALSISSGQPYWLSNRFVIPQRRGVLYVDEEMPPITSHRRSKRLMWGLGIEEPPPYWLLPRADVQFKQGESGMLLQWMRINKVEADVIVFDAMRRVIEGNENSNADLVEFWRRVEPLVKAGKTVIVLHHMNKPPTDGMRETRHRASGGTDILAGCDVVYSMSGDGKGGYVQIAGEKSRNMERDKGFTVQWSDGGDREGPMVVKYIETPQGGPDAATWGSPIIVN